MAKSLDKALYPSGSRQLRDIKHATWNYDGLVIAFGAVDRRQYWPHVGVLLHTRIIVGWLVETVWRDTARSSAGNPPVGSPVRVEHTFVVAEKRQPRAFKALNPQFDPYRPRHMPELFRTVHRLDQDSKHGQFERSEFYLDERLLQSLIWWFGRVRLVQKQGRGPRVWEFARRSPAGPYELVDPDLSELFVENNRVRSFTQVELIEYATQPLS